MSNNMDKIKIMVVDDHPAFRDGLSRLLQEESDLEVVATPEDGEQAVDVASKLKPNVIVMDISMPKMNGIEAARLIKADSPEIAILIVSAYSYQSYILAALKAGAAGYLLKNAPLHEIIKAIRMVSSGEGVFDMKVTGNLLRRLANDKTEKRRDVEELHPRELQILTLAAKGMGNKEIASNLEISERTVQTHLVNIFRKLRVSSRTEAVLQGLRQGWLTLDDLPSNEEVPG
ncbi:MAG: response regulator transcription factor [Dehalococcoidales bacterium]|nr:response regulator transcription factor [Dehalococcoidales bacterium]